MEYSCGSKEYYEQPVYADLVPLRHEAALPRGSQAGSSNTEDSELAWSERYPTTYHQERRQLYETPKGRHVLQPSSRQIPETHSLLEKLSKTIDSKGKLDSYKAGEEIMMAYEQGYMDAHKTVEFFVQHNSKRIRAIKAPEPWKYTDEHFYKKVTMANLLTNMLSITSAANTQVVIEDFSNKQNMGKIGGTSANLTRQFYYPNNFPFSGKPITVEVMPRSADEPGHLLLKRLLISILAKSCTRQSEISQLWMFSDEGEPGHRRVFPRSFFLELKELCRQYLGLNHDELLSQWNDRTSSLEFLSNYPIGSRQQRFSMLKDARSSFENTAFTHYLKESLRELRYGTFAPLEQGEEFQRFIPRPRNSRKSVEESTTLPKSDRPQKEQASEHVNRNPKEQTSEKDIHHPKEPTSDRFNRHPNEQPVNEEQENHQPIIASCKVAPEMKAAPDPPKAMKTELGQPNESNSSPIKEQNPPKKAKPTPRETRKRGNNRQK